MPIQKRKQMPTLATLKEIYYPKEDEGVNQYFHRIIMEAGFGLPGSPTVEDAIRYLVYQAEELKKQVCKLSQEKSKEGNQESFVAGYASGWGDGIEYYKKSRGCGTAQPELGSYELKQYGESIVQKCIRSFNRWENENSKA